MSRISPESIATLMEATASTEFSRYAQKIRELIDSGDIDPNSRLFRLAHADQEGWSDPRSTLTAPDLLDTIDKGEADLFGNERELLLYCILSEFTSLHERPMFVLKLENQILNGAFHPQTKIGRELSDLWLEMIYVELVDHPELGTV